jgi:Holliday junction resolvase
MNNKQLGAEFEKEFGAILTNCGYWNHFITPDARGSQPFDYIAAKDGKAYAFDCKTSAIPTFSMRRVEDNQQMAFDLWTECGNMCPYFAVKYKEEIYMIPWYALKNFGTVRIEEFFTFERWEGICE